MTTSGNEHTDETVGLSELVADLKERCGLSDSERVEQAAKGVANLHD